MKKYLLVFSIIFLFCFNIFANGNEEILDLKPTVAVSILPEVTFVEKVAGNTVDVFSLIPPGASPENYEPTIQERIKLSNAVLYFSIGVNTEKQNILPLVPSSTKIIDLASIVNSAYPDLLLEGERDPHIWLSIDRVKIMVETICSTLSELYPENANLYKTNTDNYIKTLDSTQEYLAKAFSNASVSTFLVFHPAFQYFAQDYGLEMISIESSGKEATVKELAAIIDKAKDKNIKVIFYQEEIDSRQTAAIKNELGIVAVSLAPLSQSYVENLKNMANKIIGSVNESN